MDNQTRTQSEPDGGVWQDSYGDPWWRDDDGLWHCTDGFEAARAALEANSTECSVDCCLEADHSGPHMGDDGGEWPNANPRGES